MGELKDIIINFIMRLKPGGSRTLIRSLTFLSGLIIVVISVLFAFWIANPIFSTNVIDPAIFGQYGDAVGGIVGTILAFLSVYLIYRTYKSQKEEFQLQRKELKATQDAMYDQKNDTAFFNMLSTLRQIVSEMEGEVNTVNEQSGRSEVRQLKGRQYIHQVLKKIKRDFAHDHIEKELIYNPETGLLHAYREERTGSYNEHGNEGVRRVPLANPNYSIGITRQDIGNGFLKEFEPYSYNFDHFFRFFRSIVEFVTTIEYKVDKDRYFQMLKAQLSQDELVMLFYFVLTSDDQFLETVDANQLLDPILDHRSVIDTWHHWHFPKTDFKFLGTYELKNKKEYRSKYMSKEK